MYIVSVSHILTIDRISSSLTTATTATTSASGPDTITSMYRPRVEKTDEPFTSRPPYLTIHRTTSRPLNGTTTGAISKGKRSGVAYDEGNL